MEYNRNNDDISLNLGHMILSLAQRWKSVCLLALLGALLGSIPAFLPSNEPAMRSAEDLAAIQQMELTAQYHRQYENLNAYITADPAMQFNANAMYAGQLEYYIPQCEDAQLVATVFSGLMSDEALYSELCQCLGVQDLRYLLIFEPEYFGEIKIVGEDQLGVISIPEKLKLHFTVYGETKEKAEAALGIIQEAVVQTAQESFRNESLELRLSIRTVRLSKAEELAAFQKQMLNNLDAASTNLKNAEESLESTLWEVYQSYVLTGRMQDLPNPLVRENPLKLPGILAAVFGFLSLGWWLCVYLFTPTVKTIDEVTEYYGLVVLGYSVIKRQKGCFLDRWLESKKSALFFQSVSLQYIASVLNNQENVALLYDETDDTAAEVSRQLFAENPHLKLFGFVSQNQQTLTQLTKDTKAIYLVHLEVTSKEQLQHELSVCQQFGISAAGSVVIS